jgi:2-dehydro-3-deoxyphosphogluconate aldolase/(4S)-4-hydroxy-2-oxoglutarate aldolase
MDLLTGLAERRALCIVRAESIPDPVGLAATLVEAGLPIVEFALTTPNALRLIERASTVDGIWLGAGTVLTAAQASDAISAGARFLLTPGLRPEVAAEGRRHGVPVVLGALTPSEVLAALDAGTTAVKIFPAARLGPGYVKDLHGPFPGTPLVMSGGLHAGNVAGYLAAGALAVTAGSGVVPAALAAESRFTEIRLRATEFVDAVNRATTT